MTLELFIYILFCIFALYYAYKGSKVSEMTTLKAIVAFFIGVIWFFIVRLSGFDIDINTYAGYLDNTTFLLFINSRYLLREFVFWGNFICVCGGDFCWLFHFIFPLCLFNYACMANYPLGKKNETSRKTVEESIKNKGLCY